MIDLLPPTWLLPHLDELDNRDAADALWERFSRLLDEVPEEADVEQLARAFLARFEDRTADLDDAAKLQRWYDEHANPKLVDRAIVVSTANVAAERVRWLWPARLPLGKLVVLDGDPGMAKSTITLDVAARGSTASPLADGHRPDHPWSTLILSAEDGVGDTIRPRLEAAGADLTRVHVLTEIARAGGDSRPLSLPSDLDFLESAIVDTGAQLVVIDPFSAFLNGRVDSHRDQDVRGALHPMAKLAERRGCCLLVVRHLSKAGGTNPIYRGGGSIGVIGAARVGLIVARHPDDENRAVLAVSKCNIAPAADSLVYRLVPDDEHQVARIAWEGTTSHSAAALLAVPPSEEERTERDDAVDFLRDFLRYGPRAATDVEKAAIAAGISKSTLRRAKGQLRVRSRKFGTPGEDDQEWRWVLEDAHPPPEDVEDVHPSECEHLQHLRDSGEHLREATP